MKTFLVRGVPASIQQDCWWMDGPIKRRTPPPTEEYVDRRPRPWDGPLALIALVALADLLLWGVAPGLSLVVFGSALLVAGLLMARHPGQSWGGLVLGLVLFLPALEQVQVLSVLFWLAGLLVGGAWIACGGWQGLCDTLRSTLRLAWIGPFSGMRDLLRFVTQAPSGTQIGQRVGSVLSGWALPLGLGLVFVGLMGQANPVVAMWADKLNDLQMPDLTRMVFWGGMALVIWPFLQLSFLKEDLTPPRKTVLIGPRRLPAFINPAAIRRSLILFNALFAVQTGLDMAYLWGGAELPHGMSHAEYAHRGAYPLLGTALLAGAFALIARPFTALDPGLRAALLLWIVQTVLLVISSLLRLDLYVEAYGMTRLRLAAGLWMGIVAAGLALTLWQVVWHHTAGWLLKRGAMMGLGVLYLAMFLSFDATIARYNLTHDVPRDAHYICQLGPAALPEIRRHAPGLCDIYLTPRAPLHADWREWGFRDWRVLRSLQALNATVEPPR